jgi:small subunit ribosomal protein S16
MAVKIRMRRMGSNKKPFFRIVATDERSPQSGRYLENVGWYDPKLKGKNYELKLDRVEYWKTNGAIISDSVQSLLSRARRVAAAG